MREIKALLVRFLEGPDRSRDAAKAIESAIYLRGLEENVAFQELIDYLASYQPGGGDYLYSESDILTFIQRFLKQQLWEEDQVK